MRFLAISGSLRAQSSNGNLLNAVRLLAPPDVEIILWQGLDGLPHFNPDLDGDTPPAAVVDFRKTVNAADALIVSSPEYARGVPGSFKNALDWLVGDLHFAGKPIALFSASARSTAAQDAIRLTLTTMAARIVDEASITVDLLGRGAGPEQIAGDPEHSKAIKGALEALARFVVSSTSAPAGSAQGSGPGE